MERKNNKTIIEREKEMTVSTEKKVLKCPKCSSKKVQFHDDSFAHDWAGGGVEIIEYYACNTCGFSDENNDYELEDWEVNDNEM